MSGAQGSRLGTMFGPYHLKRLLGRGGMGEVYEAEHTVKQWTVALKLMSLAYSQDPVFRKRMEREARITGRLLEPHVVPIHDYGEIDGQLYLEMRLIEGIDLGSLLERDGPLTPPRAVAIILQVAAALDAAHAAGVTHRDVKPQNILITRNDFAYLVDFGIASAKTDEKLTQMGTAVGTWKYMAPERFSSDEVTPRADVYALACVLFECLTGAPPYPADSTGVLVTSHMMEPIPLPSAQGFGVDQAFDAVIAGGMAKNPIERYASAGDLAEAAHDALSRPERDRAATILRRSETSAKPQDTQPNIGSESSSSPHTRYNPLTSGPETEPASPPPLLTNDAGAAATAGQPSPETVPGAAESVQPETPGKRSRWPILAAAGAAVVIAVAAVGIWLTIKPSPTPQQPPPRAGSGKTTAPSSQGPSNDQARLISLLPPGYLAGTCTPATPESGSIWTNAVAMVSCGQNTQPGGPSKATYGLFPTPDRLKKSFTDDIANVSLVNCPGEGASPVSWHYDQTPNEMAGLIACGTYNGHPNVIWTNEEKLMLSDVAGDPATVEDLHTWWDAYG
ncbi:putative serine/threonine-protein kinase pknh [Mycobacterium lentiflavum]|uniref:non-specific serine/threonine protein kinase n=1 Tax=Mycobacterium lentiflavum TaxID=141349 RepID=A0A0E4CNE2_MYCLN|nr:serine/threonine-protein kinase [Mycobacterium lentiflavum]MEE3066077.1 serine/threonine-protein kinase [Actinomycetota bacterium]ULP44711.1 serine/threonine protein kinase [Mycobacterium lentiflavum]CQD13757.1 putative serine/threonine-protein kinase pknh [Mycobacterium lentiflavum]